MVLLFNSINYTLNYAVKINMLQSPYLLGFLRARCVENPRVTGSMPVQAVHLSDWAAELPLLG
jgi:hypothetical protein